jgi:tRNA(adenine34) deaminase
MGITDYQWMEQAIALAKEAEQHNEVPIGAVLVKDDQCIATGYNKTIMDCDPSAHAEIIALRQAAKNSGNHRLLNTTLYVTLEPCLMCAGAIIQARITRLVYAARDPRAGAVDSVFNTLQHPQLNHRVECTDGILAEQSAALLQQFFKQRR